MRVRVAYIRVSKGLQTEAEQREALAAAGLSADELAHDAVWLDRHRKPKPGQGDYPQRDYMLGALRDGDEVWVAAPRVISSTERDALDFLAKLTGHGAVLRVASTGARYRWHPDAAEAIALARDIKADERSFVMAKARAALTGARKAREAHAAAAWKRARAMWVDPTASAVDVAKATEIPVRTLYRKLGPKGTPAFGKPPKGRKR